MRVGLLDIVEIDDRAQVYSIDAYVEIQWQDNRLAIGDVAGASDDLRTFDIDEIWTPGLLVINDRGLDLLLPEVATVDRQGNVILRQRLAGPLAVDLDLRRFPLDTQKLVLEVASYKYSPTEIRFSAASEMLANFDDLSGGGWDFSALEPEMSVYRLSEEGIGRSQLTFAVAAKRNVGYYILTLALPMLLILFLSWMAHWLPVDVVPSRIGIASATVFSFIAFGVSFRLVLPQIAYLTYADRFVLASIIVVMASLAITVYTARLKSLGSEAAASRLARSTQLAFPFVFLVVALLIIAI